MDDSDFEIKLTDLTSVFELFIFSDTLELNRELLIEGNSLILSLVKNVSDEENRFKRINVKKVESLKNIFNKPFSEISFNLNDEDQIKNLSNNLDNKGSVEVKITIKDNKNYLTFKLKEKREVSRKTANLIKNMDISTNIN